MHIHLLRIIKTKEYQGYDIVEKDTILLKENNILHEESTMDPYKIKVKGVLS